MRHKWSRRHTIRWAILLMLAVGILLVLDGAWIGYRTHADLGVARDQIRSGADALIHGDLLSAEADFAKAKQNADAAAELTVHPAGFIGEKLPWLGNNVHAIEDLAHVGSLTADAGQTLAGAAQRIGWTGHGIPGVSSSSGLAPLVLQRLAPAIAEAHGSLLSAQAILDGVPIDQLLEPVRQAVLTASGELAGRTELLGSATSLARLVPAVLASGKRYLLVVQNPGEVRGTGGFMGFYGELRAAGGHLNLISLHPAGGQKVPPVTAPADYVARYARFQSLIDMRQANFSPDLPTAAGVIMQQATEMGWGHFDGIVLVDTIWLQYMLQATGPVSVPGWEVPISSDNVVDVLGREVPALSEDRSNAIQGATARAVWEASQGSHLSPSAFATALSRSVAERHMQLWMADPTEESLIRGLGAAGNAQLGKNPLYVVWNALSASKIAVFTQHSIDVDVRLNNQGSALVTEALALKNTAPAAPPSNLLGDGSNFPVGTFEGYVSVYEPAQLQGPPTYAANAPTVTGQEHEFGHQVAIGVVGAPSGGNMTWSVTYVAPNAATKVGDGWEYRLDFIPQPTFSPPPVNITIHLPSGDIVTDGSPGVLGGNGTVTYRNDPAVPTSIWVRFDQGS